MLLSIKNSSKEGSHSALYCSFALWQNHHAICLCTFHSLTNNPHPVRHRYIWKETTCQQAIVFPPLTRPKHISTLPYAQNTSTHLRKQHPRRVERCKPRQDLSLYITRPSLTPQRIERKLRHKEEEASMYHQQAKSVSIPPCPNPTLFQSHLIPSHPITPALHSVESKPRPVAPTSQATALP